MKFFSKIGVLILFVRFLVSLEIKVLNIVVVVIDDIWFGDEVVGVLIGKVILIMSVVFDLKKRIGEKCMFCCIFLLYYFFKKIELFGNGIILIRNFFLSLDCCEIVV